MRRIEAKCVVPVVGPHLVLVTDAREGRETLLYPLLAKRLAAALGVSSGDLPGGDELQEVARRFVAGGGDIPEIYRTLRSVVRDLDPIPIPRPLAQLASMSPFDLYLATTFDVLAERAVDQARFDGQRQTLSFAFAPNDKQDLPPEFERLGRPAVFHLLGRLSGTPHSYAVTGEDTIEFMRSLDAKTEDAPGFLLDRMRRSDLLILGSRRAGWLARLFHAGAGAGAGAAFGSGDSVVFAPQLGDAEAVENASPIAFVDELYRRFCRREPADGEEAPPPEALAAFLASSGNVGGAVFLSSVAADRAIAEAIRDALDRTGVDVLLDIDDVRIAETWDRRLRSILLECALFVPLLSSRALRSDRRFFRPEWVEAILEAAKAVPSGRFVLPVAIDINLDHDHDGAPASGRAIPGEIGELPWERLHGGKPGPELLKTVVELQRSYRSARLA